MRWKKHTLRTYLFRNETRILKYTISPRTVYRFAAKKGILYFSSTYFSIKETYSKSSPITTLCFLVNLKVEISFLPRKTTQYRVRRYRKSVRANRYYLHPERHNFVARYRETLKNENAETFTLGINGLNALEIPESLVLCLARSGNVLGPSFRRIFP